MCVDCGCGRAIPFGVRVLSVLAPALLQARAPSEAGVPASAGSTALERSLPAESPAVVHPGQASPRSLEVHASLLAQNDAGAARNRADFHRREMVSINLVSSPGAGKTTLLARTLDEFGQSTRCAVVVGDLETDTDGRRLQRPGVPVAQITTGTACHLDADMVARAAAALDLEGVRVFFIENVGNLVCPASFDLGENLRVVLLSATEGEEKPLKYPPLFKSAHVVLVTKCDVAEVLGFDRRLALDNLRQIAPQARVIEVSARSGEGLAEWYALLQAQLRPPVAVGAASS